MNRAGLGLAVGAGYLLGRTRKLKLAFAVGTLVAGKRMNLSPRAVADLVSHQLQNNPQFKEIGDQLRQDLRGVGKAASGAMVERQLDALADRLHDRTSQVRGRLAGVAAKTTGAGGSGSRGAEDAESRDDGHGDDEYGDDEYEEHGGGEGREDGRGSGQRRAPRGRGAEKKAPLKKAAKKAPAKKAAGGKAPVKKAAAKKTAASGRTAGRSARAGLPKGGGER
ncbi:DNA primase [Streptomyces sp. NPDC006134]|uniref:DNA primase n=1 Tax=Streptomyces sp. NPDC006134 TaxID=3154467 RepID=UPI0033D95F0A